MNNTLLILKLLDVLALGLRVAPDAMTRYAALRKTVGEMVAEGRDPTPEEWAALNAETDDLMDTIRQSSAASTPPEPR